MELAGLRVLFATMPSHERASLQELLETAFEDHTCSLATHLYDEKGRRIETVRRMGTSSEERVTVRYDDFDNPLEEYRSEAIRELRMDDGVVQTEERPPLVQHIRFEYRYDAHGCVSPSSQASATSNAAATLPQRRR